MARSDQQEKYNSNEKMASAIHETKIKIEELCRTCLSKDNELYSLFDILKGSTVTLNYIVTSTTGIKVKALFIPIISLNDDSVKCELFKSNSIQCENKILCEFKYAVGFVSNQQYFKYRKS